MRPYVSVPCGAGYLRGIAAYPAELDAPLADEDRAGLRTLYTDPNDTTYIGSIAGRVIPANPLSLPTSPAGVTGVFGAQLVAVDVASGKVIGTLGGWSCTAPSRRSLTAAMCSSI